MKKILSVEKAIEKLTSVLKNKNFYNYKINDKKYKYESEYPFGLWFRGQSDKEWELIPKIYRENQNYDEASLFYHFKLENPKLNLNRRYNLDWLALMQHYRVPTRLLDWSENLLIALYFAVSGHKDRDGKIFMLNGRKLNQKCRIKNTEHICTPSRFEVVFRCQLACNTNDKLLLSSLRQIYNLREIHHENTNFTCLLTEGDTSTWSKAFKKNFLEKITYPIAVYPNRLNNRMGPQASVFTIYGGKQNCEPTTNEFFPTPSKIEEHPDYNKFMKEYIIPKEKKNKIKETLKMIGIHEGNVYPELEHVGNHITNLWKYKN